ncbi:hypothetical protein DH2020_021317 [Rehmannia glutinosa]|uniref:Dof zinc finger protein n=1 Tax=Rehmannia glutinosa TaxID=99300 RepID=A0ABR0WA28_REHGL
MGSQTLESMLISTKPNQEKKPKPSDQQTLKCPRCESTNTKFCYYNNYSLSQPRYFCKSCRRYWTKGGTLRNVPVGGGCRRNNKRPSSSGQSPSSTSSSSKIRIHDDHQPMITTTDHPSPIIPSFNPLSYQLGLDELGNFSISGNPNMPLSDIVGTNYPGGMYYGMGINMGLGNNGGLFGISGNIDEEMGFGEISGATNTSSAVTTMKQENCSIIGRESEISKGFLGFPWLSNNIGDGIMGDFDSSRNGIIGASNWHGFLNSPLM